MAIKNGQDDVVTSPGGSSVGHSLCCRATDAGWGQVCCVWREEASWL